MITLRAKALSGSAWTIAGFGFSQILRLASNILLAAMLFQEAFALWAIVNAVMQGLAMFSDLGLGPSVIQNRKGDDRRFLDTAWTMQIIRGVLLTAIAVAAAWPLATFYGRNDPLALELRWLLPLAAASTFIASFASSKLWTNTRHMNLAANTLIELAAQTLGNVAMLVMVWQTRSLYAVAVGGIVSAATTCLLSHFAIPGPRNRLLLDRDSFREIFGFGKWVFLSTVITFLALQLDKLTFAKLFSLQDVGVYSIAAGLAVMVPALLGRVQQAVAFPLYARLMESGDSLENVVEKTKLPMLALGSALVALVATCSSAFIDLAYDERYVDAGRYLAILSLGAWFAVVEGIYGAAFLSSGKAQWVAMTNGLKVVAFCVLLVPLSRGWGILGAVVAVAAADVVKLAATYVLASLAGIRRRGLDALFFVATAAAYAAVTGLTVALELPARLHPALLLLLQGALVAACFAWPAWRVMRMIVPRAAVGSSA